MFCHDRYMFRVVKQDIQWQYRCVMQEINLGIVPLKNMLKSDNKFRNAIHTLSNMFYFFRFVNV